MFSYSAQPCNIDPNTKLFKMNVVFFYLQII